MTADRRRSHAEEVISALRSQDEREKFTRAREFLTRHLVHKREIFNGRDFLFSGPAPEIHEALRNLRDLESRCSRFLEFDYAQVDDFFLLRIVSHPQYQDTIDTYFD